MAAYLALVDAVLASLGDGRRVAVHCNGGKGRTGTLAVAVLFALGSSITAGVAAVRAARPGTIRNPLQILWLRHRFAPAWRARNGHN
jgi:protein-tyrosine phosphatase